MPILPIDRFLPYLGDDVVSFRDVVTLFEEIRSSGNEPRPLRRVCPAGLTRVFSIVQLLAEHQGINMTLDPDGILVVN
jgi:hypothetical protein